MGCINVERNRLWQYDSVRFRLPKRYTLVGARFCGKLPSRRWATIVLAVLRDRFLEMGRYLMIIVQVEGCRSAAIRSVEAYVCAEMVSDDVILYLLFPFVISDPCAFCSFTCSCFEYTFAL